MAAKKMITEKEERELWVGFARSALEGLRCKPDTDVEDVTEYVGAVADELSDAFLERFCGVPKQKKKDSEPPPESTPDPDDDDDDDDEDDDE